MSVFNKILYVFVSRSSLNVLHLHKNTIEATQSYKQYIPDVKRKSCEKHRCPDEDLTAALSVNQILLTLFTHLSPHGFLPFPKNTRVVIHRP